MQATARGLAIAIGAFARDLVSAAAVARDLGATLAGPATGYALVYGIEILLLFGTLVALGPLVRRVADVQRLRPLRPQRISDLKGTAMHPNLTPGIDVALLVFWAFVLFFVGLVFYLRREDRREGYPLEDDVTGRLDSPAARSTRRRPSVPAAVRPRHRHHADQGPRAGRDRRAPHRAFLRRALCADG